MIQFGIPSGQVGVALLWGARIGIGIAALYGVYRRFIWGEESHVSFKQLPDPRERKWSYGRIDGAEFWSNYIHLLATNYGWWTGFLWDVELKEATFDNGTAITNASKETVKIVIAAYIDGDSERLDLQNPHQREGRGISGRDNTHFKLIPFLKPDGELGRHAESAEEAQFTFEATVKDNKGSDSVEFTATMDVGDVSFDE